MKICVIGLGKLGAPLAACLAAKGLTVIGVDNDPGKIAAINSGKPPIHEPGLGELLTQTGGRLTAVSDVEAAVATTEVTFIVVSTPSDPAGGGSPPGATGSLPTAAPLPPQTANRTVSDQDQARRTPR